jgi:hypothetical protein
MKSLWFPVGKDWVTFSSEEKKPAEADTYSHLPLETNIADTSGIKCSGKSPEVSARA